MARSARKKAGSIRMLVAIAIGAVALFALGELWIVTRSDTGRLQFARRFGLVEQAEVTRLIGRQIHHALDAAGVPQDSVSERVTGNGPAAVRWRIGLAPGASTLQLNHAITRTLEAAGAEVLSGRERWDTNNTQTVTLLVGLPRRATHELVMVRPARPEEPGLRGPARLAVVVYGFGDEVAAADSFFALPASFAVAVVPGPRNAGDLFKDAHRREREVVLHLPLEPVNYPQVNPGPGTLLVTMKPARIVGDVEHWLDQARPVSAVSNHMGSLATQDMTVMTAVYRVLRNEHLPFLHVMPAAGAVCRSLASEMGVAYDEPDAVLDSEPRASDTKALDKRWKEILAELQDRGQMVVWVRATPLTYRWLPRALDPKKMKDVDLVPLAALVRKPAPV
jgi:polysaccharide deacetylase 2 family uncharacterized protein YibQ